tara:strand:- start:655 stop:801 length:147 start_codon:yes stop_codon:yes gene_type:complete
MLREASEDVVDAGWFPANELIDHPAAKQSFVSRCTIGAGLDNLLSPVN